ncbi:MAG TPA: hypothetical protein VMW87_05815 [Spirochaetia bacterium]|nr:hypothetical protein [Spirochaetia bacterium]
MVFWPFHGIAKRLTERRRYERRTEFRTLGPQFRRSLHIFVVDAGCDNSLNFTIAALQAPQYNTHRFGIYFADTPRHADLLVLLGPPLPSLREAVAATVRQLPSPCGVLLVGQEKVDLPATDTLGSWTGMVDADAVVGQLPGDPAPAEILAALLSIQRGPGKGTHPVGGER